jgi:hypothetical protein
MAEPLFMWRVYVARALGPRQRKHLVNIYRTGAPTAAAAVTAVTREILEDRCLGDGAQIVGVVKFSDVSGVIYDGLVTKTPAELAVWAEKSAARQAKELSNG